jgi:hypothetical protein
MNKSNTTNFIRAFPGESGQAVAIFKQMKDNTAMGIGVN